VTVVLLWIGVVVAVVAQALRARMPYLQVEAAVMVEHRPSPEPPLRMRVAAVARAENRTRARQAMELQPAVVVVLAAVVLVALQPRRFHAHRQLRETPALRHLVAEVVPVDIAIGLLPVPLRSQLQAALVARASSSCVTQSRVSQLRTW